MPGLVPGIHVFAAAIKKDVDGRDKPGHDEGLVGLNPHPHQRTSFQPSDIARHFRAFGGTANCSVRSRSVMSMTVTIGAVSS